MEITFNTTNECYSHSNILENKNITLQNGEKLKYSEYINNPKYFDIFNYSFETDAENSVVAYNKCKRMSEDLKSEFFLVSDISYHNQKFHYNCYIPKNSQRCNTNTLKELISPFEEVFNKMFGVNNDIFEQNSDINSILTKIHPQTSYVISHDDYSRIDNCNNNCFRNDNQVLLPKKDYFGIFYSEYLDINSNDANVDSYYVRRSIINDISYIENNYSIDKLNVLLSDLSDSLNEYICTNPTNPIHVNNVDVQIQKLVNFYNGGGEDTNNIGFINSLENLANDISNIGQYSKTNIKYLRDVDNLVKKSNSKLNNILKLDGANNGKYNDTQYLKNQKISEIIILMLIIIFLIFIYTKKK